MEQRFKFEVETLKNALIPTNIEIGETEKINDVLYVMFKNSKLSHIKVPMKYSGRNNCINIYHGESTKNGFWWDEEINYQELVNELVKYH